MKPSIPPVLITFALVYFALVQNTQAVVPAPDGGYPGGNTAEGQSALQSLTSATYNTAIGFFSLRSNTTGNLNTAVGAGALLANVGGPNGDGNENTAIGIGALLTNTTGNDNIANGAFALFSNIDGSANTAIGVRALFSNTGGYENIGIGEFTLLGNTTGSNNTAIGTFALSGNITGSANIALGLTAGINITTGDNNIDIGNEGVAGDANTIRIGGDVGFGPQTATFIAGIRDVTTGNADAIPVLVDSAGQLGTVSSSVRFKSEIKPMDKASEAILALKPVTFHYKSDKTGTPQFGLIAEEVAEVNPDLVVRDENGEIYTVRYDAVNAMLLNEFLKEHRKVEEQECSIREQEATITEVKSNAARQEATIALQQQEIQALIATVKEQTAQIQKVNARFEMNKSAPQVAENNQ